MVFSISLADYFMEKIIIVGGGVAGLSCLNAFLDQSISPLLLEGGKIGSPKMCGEFLAPSALPYLKTWGIENIQQIDDVCFHVGKKNLKLRFPKSAGAISRAAVENALALRAKKLNGNIRQACQIEKIIPGKPHLIYLKNGEVLQTENLILATGKFTQQNLKMKYVGIKCHLPFQLDKHSLQMFSDDKAYFGLVPIEENKSNLTCLVRRNVVNKFPSVREYFEDLISRYPLFENRFECLNYLEGFAPEFGAREVPNWGNTFAIGDATFTPHPAIGLGFANSVESGVKACEAFCLGTSNEAFREKYLDGIKDKMFWGRVLHEIYLRPGVSACLLPVVKKIGAGFILKLL